MSKEDKKYIVKLAKDTYHAGKGMTTNIKEKAEKFYYGDANLFVLGCKMFNDYPKAKTYRA